MGKWKADAEPEEKLPATSSGQDTAECPDCRECLLSCRCTPCAVANPASTCATCLALELACRMTQREASSTFAPALQIVPGHPQGALIPSYERLENLPDQKDTWGHRHADDRNGHRLAHIEKLLRALYACRRIADLADLRLEPRRNAHNTWRRKDPSTTR